MSRSALMASAVAGIALVAGLSVTGTTAGMSKVADGANGYWTQDELAVLASLRISALPAMSKDPSNAFEDMPAAVELGKRLFTDQRFSSNGAVSCASCHDPKTQFQDGRAVSKGVGTGGRRAMPVVDLAHNPWLFWDGRKDSLWSQALGPLEDSVEHGGNRLLYAHVLRSNYRSEYESLFGPMPDLSHLPRNAGPNGSPSEQAAWHALDGVTRNQVSRLFANMGKAIAAYEKTLHYGGARFDRYVDRLLNQEAAATPTPLTPQEINGLKIFIGKGECVTCHGGPLLTDQHFHNTGVPPRDPANPDRGRSAAVRKVLSDEFNCLGKFSDASQDQCQELQFIAKEDHAMEGAFKTPSLRNVALRPPYMHAGQIGSLNEVIQHYVRAPKAAVGHSERKPLRLSETEVAALSAFLGSISGPIIESSINRQAGETK
ncbi:cytochrome c peroxidase [soil metagenome]